jgi:hypothetical protein
MPLRRVLACVAGAITAGCLISIGDLESDGRAASGGGNGGSGGNGGGGDVDGGAGSTSGGASGAGGAPADVVTEAAAGGASLDAEAEAPVVDAAEESAPEANANPDCDNGVLALRDDFAGSTISSVLWDRATVGSSTIWQTQGLLEIDIDPDSQPISGRLASARPHDLSGCSAFIEVLETTRAQESGYSVFAAAVSDGDYVAFVKTGTFLSLEIWKAGKGNAVRSLSYLPTEHAWWRFEVDTLVRWSVSADGKSWSELASAPPPFAFTAVTMLLEAGTSQAETNDPGRFRIGGINVPP